MTLSEIIYQKSRQLPNDKAQEVIDFIDFLIMKTEPKDQSGTLGIHTPEQQKAYSRLTQVQIDWQGKPIADREEANARR